MYKRGYEMKKVLFGILISVFAIANVFAGENFSEDSIANMPRMVSIRSNNVNARSGPGSRYPIEWVYKQKNAPVEVVAEFEYWKKIKDWEGSESWVHKSMLANKRTIKLVKQGESNIYTKPNSGSEVVAKVESGVVGEVKQCPKNSEYCLIKFDKIEGWVAKRNFFGVYPKEVIN